MYPTTRRGFASRVACLFTGLGSASFFTGSAQARSKDKDHDPGGVRKLNYEGKPADIEYAHGLPGDLLVVGATDVDQRPSLTQVRCPVAVVPPQPASASGDAGSTPTETLVEAGETQP